MAGGHSAKRMTRRLPMVVFFNIVDISALNAMNIWLKFQTTLQFNNRTRRSFSPYNIGQITCWTTSNGNPPIQRPVAPNLVLLNSTKRYYLHSSKKRQEIKDQQLQMSTMQALQQTQRHAVNGFNVEDKKQLQWLPSSI